MGNVTAPNFVPYHPLSTAPSNDARMVIWKLTRVLKAAGWIYKCSSTGGDYYSGLGRDITGDPAVDRWNGYGSQMGSQSGSAASISGNPVTNVYTITGLTGMSASSVGRILLLSGCAYIYANNSFKIVAYNSASSVNIYSTTNINNDANNGKISWSEREIMATVAGQTGSSASITTKTSNRIMTITGLTGMLPGSTNRYLTLSGANSAANNGTFKILKWLSSTSVTIINDSGVASDTNNGSISWKETDPLLESYPFLMQNAWICMQGPSTVKVPITVAATGTFLRGENITQSTTGAQGEVIGYQWDSTGSTGFLVVMPRVNGSGAGRLGWGTNSITGDLSGATVTPSATPIEYVREVVFGNPSTTAYYLCSWIQCVDAVAENASRFSVLGGTTTAPPGAGAFPAAGSYVTHGDATSTGYGYYAMFSLGSFYYGTSHNMCADATYDEGRSADGSFASAIAINTTSPSTYSSMGAYCGFVYTRCDAQEDGDVDPYIWYQPMNTTPYSVSRTSGGPSYFNAEYFTASYYVLGSTSSVWNQHLAKGWRRRGFSTGDAWQNFQLAVVGIVNSATSSFNGNAWGAMGTWYPYTSGSRTFVNDQCAITTKNNTLVGEPVWAISTQSSQKMRKGICRWIRAMSAAPPLSLFNGGTWIRLSGFTPGFIVGPWDSESSAIR